MWCLIRICYSISMCSSEATYPLTSRHIARSAHIEGGLRSQWVHCVLLGSLLTTVAVQPGRMSSLHRDTLLPLNMHLAHCEWSTRRRRSEIRNKRGLAVDLQNKKKISRKTISKLISRKRNLLFSGFLFCDFAISEFKFLQILFFAFCGDRPARPPGANSEVGINCVISARRWPARRRNPAHTCLLRPKLHAVDVLSF
jgi:hypothetical protein